ncbi:MAG: PQQ-binding-like beta-propeller repeat protein [Gemmataceae bacterium]
MRMTLLAVALVCAGLLAADWPQLRGPKRDGHSAEADLIDTFGPKGPPVAWRREVGEGYAAPAVAGDRLALFHRVGDSDAVECLDASSGKPRWKFTYPTRYDDPLGKGNGPRATPVIAGGRVFTLGAGGQLHALDLKDGKKLWGKTLLDDYTVKPSYFGVGTTPLVEGKLLLVNVGGEGAGVVALDVETGKERWRAGDDDASYSSPVAATVGGARRVVFFTRTGLVMLDPETGKVLASKRWRARIDASVNAAMPVLLGDDHLLLTASYGTGAVVLRLTRDGVEEVWKNATSLSSHFGTPVAVGEQLYGFEGRQEGGASLRCLDWKTGRVRWTEPGYGCGDLIAAGKKLFVMSEGGELVLLVASAARHDEKARARVLAAPFRSHLALANGLLYARDGRELVAWGVKR